MEKKENSWVQALASPRPFAGVTGWTDMLRDASTPSCLFHSRASQPARSVRLNRAAPDLQMRCPRPAPRAPRQAPGQFVWKCL